MQLKNGLYQFALVLWLVGAAGLATAQFFVVRVETKECVAMMGFSSLYFAVLVFGSLGVSGYRASRRASKEREKHFFNTLRGQ